PNEANDVSLQAAEWGPKNAQLIFVYGNNIYYMPDPSENQIYRISNDDNRYIYNGIPDWIYEEEILATGTAFWWSIDGTRLAYARFNDSEVEIQEYPWYGDQVDTETQYLAPIKIKYPKVREILFIILRRKDKTSVYCISHLYSREQQIQR
ncbi:dipeptidyl peptidase IV-like protein, partial [Euroglyphus maynei]